MRRHGESVAIHHQAACARRGRVTGVIAQRETCIAPGAVPEPNPGLRGARAVPAGQERDYRSDEPDQAVSQRIAPRPVARCSRGVPALRRGAVPLPGRCADRAAQCDRRDVRGACSGHRLRQRLGRAAAAPDPRVRSPRRRSRPEPKLLCDGLRARRGAGRAARPRRGAAAAAGYGSHPAGGDARDTRRDPRVAKQSGRPVSAERRALAAAALSACRR